MKRLIILLLLFVFLWGNNSAAYAVPTDFNGGVNNEFAYEEWVFVSGQAIKFVGSFTITEKERNNQKTISYKFQLTPDDKSISAKLDRNTTFSIDYSPRTDKGQTISHTKLDSYKETINIDGVRYELDDYQFNKSDAIDNQPASDFSLGTFEGRKYYTINRNQGHLIVTVSGGEAGYDNFWGSTHTQIINYFYDSARTILAGGDNNETENANWTGTVRVNVTDSVVKSLRYDDNTPVLSSFAGAHMRVTNQETSSILIYDMPRIDADGYPHPSRRDQYTVTLAKQMVPIIDKLIIPKFRDLGGHWAEDHVNKLYSLDVFAENSAFFVPDIPITRLEFIRAVVKACDIRPSAPATRSRVSARRAPPEVSPFNDFEAGNPDYVYVKSALEKGIASGVSDSTFSPGSNLTRVQAVTILIRALGYDSVAPTPGYFTTFFDNDQIPGWGIDGVYMAQRIGLISGDFNNRFNPNQPMTKAEAAAMLVRFLEFLHIDLQKDYRENIVLFNT